MFLYPPYFLLSIPKHSPRNNEIKKRWSKTYALIAHLSENNGCEPTSNEDELNSISANVFHFELTPKVACHVDREINININQPH